MRTAAQRVATTQLVFTIVAAVCVGLDYGFTMGLAAFAIVYCLSPVVPGGAS